MPLKKPTSRLVPKRPTQRYRYVRLRWHLLFMIFDAIGGIGFGVPKLVKAIFSKKATLKHDEPVHSILIIQLDHLGDAILSTGMLQVLRKKYPKARIDVLVGPWNRPLFEEMIPDVDRVLVFDGGGRLARQQANTPPRFQLARKLLSISRIGKMSWPVAILQQGLKLRRERYDLGIDVRGEMPHAAMMWIARIRRRVGWTSGGGGFLLTDSPKWVPDRPEIESRRALLETIGLNPNRAEMLPRLTVGNVGGNGSNPSSCSRELGTALENTQGQALPLSDRYIVLHLTAGTRAKEWPLEYWAELTSELVSTPSTEIVLVGSPADHIIGQKLEKLVTEKSEPGDRFRLHNLIGRLSLLELAGVLQSAELMIGADSGPAHMAAAVGTRTIVLFSGTNRAEQWRPPGDHVTVIKHDVPCCPCHQKQSCPVESHPCMMGIAPQQVIKKITEDRRQRTEGASAPI